VENMLGSGRKVNFDGDEEKIAINIAREKLEDENLNETEEEFLERSEIYGNIIELIKSFQRNPNETITNLRIKLGLIGINFFFFFSFFLFFFFFSSFSSYSFFSLFFLSLSLKYQKKKESDAGMIYWIIVFLCDNFLQLKK